MVHRVLGRAALVAALLLCGAANAVTADEVVSGIQSESADVRLEAAVNAGQLGAEGIDAIAPYLDADSWPVHKAALTALQEIVRQSLGKDQEAAVAVKLLGLTGSEQSERVRREALRQLAFAGGADQASAIAALLTDETIGEQARLTLTEIPGEDVDRVLLQHLEGASPDLQARLAASLADRQVDKAIPKLIELARNSDGAVRWEVVDSLARLGVLPNEAFPVQAGFSRDDQERYMQAAFTAADALADRGETERPERVYMSVLQNTQRPHLITYALTGLAKIDSDRLLPNALAYLAVPGLHETVHRLIIELDGEDVNSNLAAAYRNVAAPQQAAILELLADRGALDDQLAQEALASDAPIVRVTARRLTESPPDADDLYTVAEGRQKFGAQEAFAEYMELARRRADEGDVEGARQLLERVAAGPLPGTNRLEAVGQLEQLASIQALPGLENIADTAQEPELRAAAQRARVGIIAAAGPSETAARDLMNVVKDEADESVLNAARDALAKVGGASDSLARQRGYITNWQVVGPISATDDAARKANPVNVGEPLSAVTAGDETFSWKPVTSDSIPAVVDLKGQFARTRDVMAYAYTEVAAPAPTDVKIHVGSDDGYELYLNGKKISENLSPRGYQPNQDTIDARLELGVNKLLIKVVQHTDDWKFSVRITLPDGTPLDLTDERFLHDGFRF